MLSEQKKLIKRLHSDLVPRLNSEGVKDETVALLKELRQLGSWEVIPYLLSLLLSYQKEVASEAAACVAHFMDGMQPPIYSRLDERVRGNQWYTDQYRRLWDESGLEIVSILRGVAPPAVFMGLCSMHRNGKVREIAIQELDQIMDGSEVPFLLLRTTDWVPIVSTKAKQAIRGKRLTSTYAKHFFSNMSLIDQLRQRLRGDSASLFQSMQELCLKADTDEFMNALKNKDFKSRRLCFYLGLGAQKADRHEIITAGLKNKDNIVRKIALMAAIAQSKGDQLWELIESALQDRFPTHRRGALELLLNHFPEKADPYLQKYLIDQAAPVRSLAKHHVKERDGSFDFPNFYKGQFNSTESKKIVAALHGLTECKRQEDYETIEPFLNHESRPVKKAAMGCLAYLNKERTVRRLLEFMCSAEPGIAKEAQRNLQKCFRYVTGEELWKIYSTSKTPKIQIDVLRVIMMLPQWDSLGYLLLALRNKDEEVKSVALESVKWWQTKYRYTWRNLIPNKMQAERVRLAAPLIANEITGTKYREIHLAIDSVL